MNWAEMVMGIVLIGTIGKVLMARYGVVHSRRGESYSFRENSTTQAENDRLRDELKAMKDRLAVLERIATDKEDSGARLDREIEKLRDRP